MTLAGILLDAGILDSTWFRVFSLFVAINTLIYLGLTLAKFVPWPRQMHPRQVRALLRAPAEDSPLHPATRIREPEFDTAEPSGDPYADARLAVARRSVHRALGLLGIQVVAVNVAQLAIFPHVSIPLTCVSVGFGLTGIIMSITLGRHRERPRVAIWLWALLATAFVIFQCIHSIGDRVPLDLADAIIVLVLIPPIALTWSASLVSSALCSVAIMAAVIVDQGSDSLASLFAILSATFGGLIVMHLRRVAIDETTTATLELTRHPTTDPLTGVLSLDALRTLAPNLFALSRAAGTPVHLTRVRIDDLASLRLDYGSSYIAELLTSMARALGTLAAPGDLLARGSADEFLLVGMGMMDADTFRERLDAQLAIAPVDLGKRPTRFTISVQLDDDGAAVLAPVGARTR